jgi:hypothetical protein
VSRLHTESTRREATRHETRKVLSLKRLRDEARIIREDRYTRNHGLFLSDPTPEDGVFTTDDFAILGRRLLVMGGQA